MLAFIFIYELRNHPQNMLLYVLQIQISFTNDQSFYPALLVLNTLYDLAYMLSHFYY